jgi:hypothetical protein
MGNRPGHDPDNNDLYAALLSLTPASGAMAVKAAPAVVPARPDRLDAIERTAIQRMRNLRVNTGAGELRLMRGEFRRHSEISMAETTAPCWTSGVTSLTPGGWTGWAAAITITAARVNTPGGSRRS